MNDKKSVSIYIDQDLLEQIDFLFPKSDSRSRNEFIVTALRYYITHLDSQKYTDLLAPAFESVIGAKIKDTENRLARVLFKLGVEVAMMMHVVAATNNIQLSEIDKLRKMCVDQVSRINGRLNFEDAVKFQKS